MALITVADFQVHFPHLVGTANNPELQAVISQVDALLALYCGFPVPDAGGARTLEAATYTFYPNGPHSSNARRLVLPLRPIVSVTSVHVDPAEDYASSSEVPAGERVLDAQRGEIWLKPSASRSWAVDSGRANRVVVVAGFATTPPDLKALAISATRHVWDRRRTQGVASQSAAGVAQTYTDPEALLPVAVRDGLGPYRLWGVDVH